MATSCFSCIEEYIITVPEGSAKALAAQARVARTARVAIFFMIRFLLYNKNFWLRFPRKPNV